MSSQSDEIILGFFTDLLGFEPDVHIETNEEEVFVDIQIDPEYSGVLIGHRGEVLTSIQLVLSLILQESRDNWFPVRININDYREQRNQSLKNLALNAASRALDTGTPIQLSNLSSYERRIVHSELSENEEIETFSHGEGKNRVLIISPLK